MNALNAPGEKTMTDTLIAYIKLARPKHWIKNALVFAPLLYARRLLLPAPLISACFCFVSFCLISSAVYAINDIFDAPEDRARPEKRSRPVALGQIKPVHAGVFATLLAICALLTAAFGAGSFRVAVYAGLYLLLNIAYSLRLKRLVIIDCFCVAAGFVLRVFAGGAAGEADVSGWLFLTMFAASLFMAFGKRRGELARLAASAEYPGAKNHVTLYSGYDPDFLSGMVYTFAGLSIVFYSLWALQNTASMIYSAPLIVFIICRYLLIIRIANSLGDPTTIILGDLTLKISIILFILLSVCLIYFSGES